IDCLDAAANLEVKLGPINPAGVPGPTNHVAPPNLMAASDCDAFSMSVGCDIAVGMRNQDEIPVTAQRAHKADDPAGRGTEGCAFFRRNVDPVVPCTVLA